MILCTWSGGIDSTAVLGQLLSHGHVVRPVSIELPYGPDFNMREWRARKWLWPYLEKLANEPQQMAALNDALLLDGRWLEDLFSESSGEGDGLREIPRRNKRIMDHLLATYGVREIAMGEYIGCDTWTVQDHVPAQDCDARALTAYLYSEYGMGYRLWTLADFGACRYKHERLAIGIDALGVEAMAKTTNCLHDRLEHCGTCYKCVERAAAFHILDLEDATFYDEDPTKHKEFGTYLIQMSGRFARADHASFV